MMDKSTLKNLIATDLPEALKLTGEYFKDDLFKFNEYIGLLSRFNDVQRKNQLGTISEDNLQVEENRIRLALINLIDREDNLTSGDQAGAVSGIFANSFFGGTPPAGPFTGDNSWPHSGPRPSDPRSYNWKDRHPFFQETFIPDEKETSVFQNYQEEKWTARLDGGVFSLINTVDPYAVKYHYLSVNQQEMSGFPFSVEIKIEAEPSYPKPGGGLVFCFDDLTRKYYTFHINNDREFSLWRKNENAYATIFSGRSNAILPNEFNKLGIIRERDKIFMFINDEYVKSVQDDALWAGDSGLIAIGQGHFHFDNLSFYKR